MGDRGYELVEYRGGVRVPRIFGVGPFRIGGREFPISQSNQVALRQWRNEFGEISARLAVIEGDSIRVTHTTSEYTYDSDNGRVVPIGENINRDPDLGGRIGLRRARP